jgi:hypothetical protein
MSTFISEPGTRLGGRYRLEDRIAAAAGWAAWKAIDEILARAVTVFTFAPGFPRIREVVTAARSASRLTDARLAQVFDVEENWDQAYVVMEWVAGDSLHDMLADGPLEPGQSAEIIAEGADALASAHAAGVAHLCLTPGSLRWTKRLVLATRQEQVAAARKREENKPEFVSGNPTKKAETPKAPASSAGGCAWRASDRLLPNLVAACHSIARPPAR